MSPPFNKGGEGGVVTSNGSKMARQARSAYLGIACGSTYQGALEPQKMLFWGRVTGSSSSNTAGIKYSFLSRMLCGTRDPQRVQKETAKVFAAGSLKWLTNCSPADHANCPCGTKMLAACALPEAFLQREQ